MFPERLKALRKEAKLTQKQMAEALNIKQPTYAQWENGRTKPKGETLERFANFFNVSTDYLLGKTDIKNSSELTETDIEEILNNDVISYDGKPMTEHDREILTQVIKDYFDGKLKDYD
ncbi:helix-turn-helix domain-containing protein [Streptococcus gallolyticus]|uniref:Transcriptional regulator, XRE family n=1 Tax=Streptococcus gallolyticus TaxID=315405 RepID=A0A139R3G1_9STRE|nr:helix-turn-helix transcriptional regulator [Streptococcus gallolyticus]KXT67240.1 Transcriptional regulator, XRE family [Streptococcus gallolyticus]KXU09194.1 Transcriptional regulator, XRE family [Streptococcus gallolyticus]